MMMSSKRNKRSKSRNRRINKRSKSVKVPYDRAFSDYDDRIAHATVMGLIDFNHILTNRS